MLNKFDISEATPVKVTATPSVPSFLVTAPSGVYAEPVKVTTMPSCFDEEDDEDA